MEAPEVREAEPKAAFDLLDPEFLVVRLRGYDREAELAYFDQQAPAVLAQLRASLPRAERRLGGTGSDADFSATLVEVFRLFRVAVGHARNAADLPELLDLARKKAASQGLRGTTEDETSAGDAIENARKVLALDPRPKVFTAAEERNRFRVRMIALLLAIGFGLLINRWWKLSRNPSDSRSSSETRSPGGDELDEATQTTK